MYTGRLEAARIAASLTDGGYGGSFSEIANEVYTFLAADAPANPATETTAKHAAGDVWGKATNSTGTGGTPILPAEDVANLLDALTVFVNTKLSNPIHKAIAQGAISRLKDLLK